MEEIEEMMGGEVEIESVYIERWNIYYSIFILSSRYIVVSYRLLCLKIYTIHIIHVYIVQNLVQNLKSIHMNKFSG